MNDIHIKMNQFELAINYFRDVFRKEGMTGMDSIKHSILFILFKFLTFDTCKLYNIDNTYSFDKLRFDENDKLLDFNLFMEKIYNKTINCLVGQIYNKLHFKMDFKLENYNNVNLILNKLKDIDINNLHLEFDIIGTIYELHLKTGTSQAMRDLGQYYSNRHLINYMIKLCKPKNNESILDPTCGSGGFLSMSVKYLNDKYKNIDWSINKQNIHGSDIDDNVKNMTLLNLLLETGQLFDTILKQDSLKINNDTKFDIILANEPFGLKNIIYDECCDKIKKLKIKGNKGEPLFIQLMMESLNINGRCAVIIPEGILFNESKLYLETRKHLIKNYNLKKIIYMNDSFFMNTNVKCSILFFKNDKIKTSNVDFVEIKFVDNIINETLLVNVDIKLIIENNYNLNLNKYIKNDINKIENIEYKKLGEICDFCAKSKRLASFGSDSGKYPFYTSSQELTKYCDEIDYKDNDYIIIGCGGNPNIHFNNNFSCSGDCIVIKATKYIYYYIKNNINILEEGFKGATIKHISKEYIKNIEIPIPSNKIQNKIVCMLDIFNNQIENNKKSILNYDLLKKYIVEINTFNCKQIKKLDEICEFCSKSKKLASFGSSSGKYPFYTSSQELTKYCNEIDYKNNNYIIIGCGGNANINYNTNFSCSGDCIVMKATIYIYYYIKNNMNILDEGFKGATIKHISKEYIKNIKIPIPTIEIQEQIIKDCDYYDKQIKTLKKENELLIIQNSNIINSFLQSI